MVNQTNVKIYRAGGRHQINLRAGFVNDSSFPFTVGEELIAKIDGDRIIIERPQKEG